MKSYCTQNDGDCSTCSLVSYRRDCRGEPAYVKTAHQLADEIRVSTSDFVTYGDGDLGIPVRREDAIRDIECMADELIGEGTWSECDSTGAVK